MCKAVEEIKLEGRAEGRAEGNAEGMINTLVSLVRDGLLSKEIAAERASMSLEEFEEKLKDCEMNM